MLGCVGVVKVLKNLESLGGNVGVSLSIDRQIHTQDLAALLGILGNPSGNLSRL